MELRELIRTMDREKCREAKSASPTNCCSSWNSDLAANGAQVLAETASW
jgi:hypothetical protein